MDAVTARPTLLSAARNFVRKSAGTAVLAIAPLAAVALAPEANAQTVFHVPTSGGSLQKTGTEGSFFSGGGTELFSSYLGNGARFGRSIRFITNGTSGGFSGGSLTIGLADFTAITPVPGLNESVDFTYDFTLALDAGLTLQYWGIVAKFNDGAFDNASVTLAEAFGPTTGNLAGSGSFLTPLSSNNYYSVALVLGLSATGDNQSALITMSGAQGVTLNATAVPEPSTYAMIFGVGALGLVLIRRARRVSATA